MSKLLEATEAFVSHLLTEELDPRFLYHNLEHTRRVVQSTKELLAHYDLSEKEQNTLLLAAWLHDTGYIRGRDGHEKASARIAANFLRDQGLDQKTTEQVCAQILATERYHQPVTLSEEIIRDADASHLGQEIFPEVSELLKEELAQMDIAHHSWEQWRELYAAVFQNEHQFYTDYAKKHWQAGKDKNLQSLLKD
jgi:HD superfamily phosphodiesterase